MKRKLWRFQNTALLIFSLVLLYFVSQTRTLKSLIEIIGDFGFLGAFVVGIFFCSSFTIAPAILVLYNLGLVHEPYELAFFAGLGAVLGDYTIYKYLKDRVFEELVPVYNRLAARSHLRELFATPFFAWLTPVIGALIIASPIPDEVGITLLSVAKLKKWQFLAITFTMNFIGVFVIATLARLRT